MIRLTYIVLSCHDLLVSKKFYEALGLLFQEEKHGSGPTHFSSCISGIVLELYPAKSHEISYADPRRIGVSVENITEVVRALGKLQVPYTSPKNSSDPSTVLCRDPDGRTLEICENKNS